MPTILDIAALQNISRNAAKTRDGFASVDYSCLTDAGTLADFAADFQGLTFKCDDVVYEVSSLDPADDTNDNAATRVAARSRMRGNIERNARKALNLGRKGTFSVFWADAPDTSEGAADDATIRAIVVQRLT